MAALLVVLVGASVACSSGAPVAAPHDTVTATPAPTPTPTPTPSSAPEPSPSADAAPARPAAMERADSEGAAAAAQYFLGLDPYIMRTGDTATWDAMTSIDCEFCSKSKAQAQRYRDDGSLFSGGDIRTAIAAALPQDDLTGAFSFVLDVTQEDATVTTAAGETSIIPGGAGHLRAEIIRGDAGWVVLEIGLESEAP